MSLDNTALSVTNIIRGLIHDKVKIDGRDSFIYKTDNIFPISEDFIDSSTIAVFKNGVLVASQDYSYDSDNNKVTISFITSGEDLNENDTILITYSYFEKYSNDEIKGYIESSLSYFVQYKYKKTFELNSSDKIVSINDFDPTTEELYFIAIIASILIDPQNVDINIPDLRLTARREKSDQDQIKEAFINFKKFLGKIETRFLEIDSDE